MNKTRPLVIATAAVLMLATGFMSPRIPATAKAAPGPKPATAINVTSTIFNTDLNGTALLTQSDNYNGVGQASYTTIKGSRAAGNFVTSEITVDGQWKLALSAQAGRTVYITPNVPVDGLQPSAVPPAGYYVIQKAYSNCRDAAGTIIPYPNLISGGNDCSMAINFFYNDILYKLLMRPGALEDTTCPTGGCPATGLAKVTCNTVTSGKCTNWTLEPNAAAANVGVVNLYSYTGGSSGPWVFIGQYYNTFRVKASNP